MSLKNKQKSTQTDSWLTRVACVNCRYYTNHWCVFHDTPACPHARCDEFKHKVNKDRKDREP